ncbi:sulfatase-like hydrolase/transferase [Arthrobacter caoxuetaonis]|uniref:Sulfatase-like hydrolase/transferase n=1 Tax=Arthrobacter caoxuetaonis TaxID=2886935 RepID=A0A9X1ME99_9MICC|nr:sulfatase-like hydrolase/transferase [Arthrobacter caoxuetaonis]MCC3283307.1 sulfatase-like hydrolase/transferase [Arthrobacter caoxuetaonis]MCC3298434.1 sulfatase-like hydrolase/transferase [Arthrobacter caoxuetaonis]USQ57552.1 sulfatase-like hydrolase/transferase [Arthrobacter caoxuetaonis]
MSGRLLHATRRGSVALGHVLVYVLIWAGLVMLSAAGVIHYTWGRISFGQMLLNLKSVDPDGGGGSIVWTAILAIGVAPVLLTLAIAFFQQRRRHKRKHLAARQAHRPSWTMRVIATFLVSAVVVGGTTAFVTTVGIADYIKAANSKYDVGNYYVEPTVTAADSKRNLVLIYLESGEQTLADDQLFEKDAFAPLKEVTQEADGWQSIEDFQQYQGGGWTMAGLVSTQCGIPLKGTVFGAGDSAATDAKSVGSGDVDTYLGGVTCLGDILQDQGYTSTFMGGARSSFAAKDTFLSGHGYSQVKGLDDWRAADEPENSFRSDWGLSDERLMANAKEEVDRLHAQSEETGQPFNLSVLTLDTHEPVHIYDYCTVDTENKVTSAFACSMTQVAGFVEHMKAQGYLEDTAVVIMGDHLKHMSAGDAFHEQLDHHENRTIFNRIWVPGGTATEPRSGVDQLSMLPTILEAAGLTVQDRQAGLGVSAFAPTVPEGSAQAVERDVYAELLESLSPNFYTDAWAAEALAR